MYPYQLLLIATVSSLVTASTFTNPLKSRNGADPAMVYVEGKDGSEGYYYLLNTASKGIIEIIKATTLEGLKNGTTKNVWSDNTPSRCCNMWAPEAHELNGTWYMYYTASSKDSPNHRPYVLKGGATPWDAYTFLGQLSTSFGIDGSVIQFPNHGHYFIWSCMRSPENHQAICIAPLSSPSTIGRHSVISSPTHDWERHGGPVNEGPHALYHANKTYMTFSASSCGTKYYSLGLLTWTGYDPMYPKSWIKTGPVLSGANGNIGTGHNGFFRSPDRTETWNVFHAEDQFPEGSCGQARYTMAERIYFNDTDDTPIFEKAMDLSSVQQAPSGESNSSGTKSNQEPSPSRSSTPAQSRSSIPTQSGTSTLTQSGTSTPMQTGSSTTKQNISPTSQEGYSGLLTAGFIVVILTMSSCIL